MKSIADKMFEDLTYGKEENEHMIVYWSNVKQISIGFAKNNHNIIISSYGKGNIPNILTFIEPGEFRAMAQKLKEMEG